MSLYTAEVCSVWQALCYCEYQGRRKFVICTDSLNLVTALDNSGTVGLLLQQIMSLCYALDYIGSSFAVIWHPGHVDIEGMVMKKLMLQQKVLQTAQKYLQLPYDLRTKR